MALARLAALRQQAARAQAGLSALSAPSALSSSQPGLCQPWERPWPQIAGSNVDFKHHWSHTSAGPALQPFHNTASQPAVGRGYVASAQPELAEDDQEVRGALSLHDFRSCSVWMSCM